MKYLLTPLEQEIKKMYLSWDIRRPDQIDLFKIAEHLDIWIHIDETKSRAFENEDGLFSIFLDSRLTVPEQWMDFGHELKHVLYDEGNQLEMPKSFLKFQEYKANNFALQFCVPTFMLLDSGLPSTWNEAILFIMETFSVTESFARKKLIYFERQVVGLQFHEALWEAQRVAEMISNYMVAK